MCQTDTLSPEAAGKLQHTYLLAAGIMEVVAITSGAALNFIGFNLMETYLIIPALLFWGVTLARKLPRQAWTIGGLCLAMALWGILARTIHLLQEGDHNHIGLFLGVTLLPLPFAALTGDGPSQKGLKTVALCYIAAVGVLCLNTALLLLDLVPGFLADSIRWDGARLYVLWHPNVGGCLFLLGILLSLGMSFRYPRFRWAFLAGAAAMFGCLSLTHSRTSTLIACGGVGALAFFALAAKGGWKGYVLGILAALVLTLGLFQVSDALYTWNEEALIRKYTQEAQNNPQEDDESSPLVVDPESGEVKLRTSNDQGELSSDIFTLNGRTKIWRRAAQVIRENPSILLVGHADPGTLMFYNWDMRITHSHNAWIEVLLRLGLPGLALALAFTWIAFRGAVTALFRRSACLWQKSVALLVLCVLAASILEPYLFGSDASYQAINFLFYLAAGYLDQWYRAGRKPRPEKTQG